MSAPSPRHRRTVADHNVDTKQMQNKVTEQDDAAKDQFFGHPDDYIIMGYANPDERTVPPEPTSADYGVPFGHG